MSKYGFRKRKVVFFVLVLLILGLSSKAGAEEPETESEEIVVTATRRPTRPENAPAVVNVITEEDIKNLPWRNVGDLLKNEVGVITVEPQGMGIVIPQSVNFRGIRSTNKVLILVDGQPWNSGFTDFNYFSQIPVEAIKRIEVVRGPFSSLYGSNAMGGVIHIITKNGMGKKATASASSRFGDFGREEYTATASAYYKLVSGFLSYNTYRTNNYYLNDEHEDILDTENRDHEHDRFHAHMLITPGADLLIHLSGGGFISATGFGMAENLGFDNECKVERYYINLHGSWAPTSRTEIFFGLDYLTDEHIYTGETLTKIEFINVGPPPPAPPVMVPQFNYEPSRNESGFDRTRVLLGMNYDLTERDTLTLGGEYFWVHGFKKIIHRDTGELLDVLNREGEDLDEREENYSLFIQNYWSSPERILKLVFGARYDYYEGFGKAWSPKGAVIAHYHENGRVKISVGRAFRAPSFSERLSPPWTMAPFLTYIGNPDLEAEKATSYEISFENEFFEKKLKTRITPFLTFAEDFITTVTLQDPFDPSGNSILKQPDNVEEVEIQGIETEIIIRPFQSLKIFGNHQYSETRDGSTGEILDNHPFHIARFGTVWYNPKVTSFMGLSTSMVGRYVSEQNYTEFQTGETGKLHEYTVFDGRVAAEFWHRRIGVFIDVYNIFNDPAHMTSATDYVPERNFMAGAQLSYEH